MQVQIFREFNSTPSVVCNLWKQFQDTGSIENKPGKGRPRATMAREDRHLSITGCMWTREFILMDDNVKLVIDESLESEDIRRMDWQARSSDLSPIKHV
ncbi:DDE_3 domain-containing protein [Trichonephila clavipes]|nr:DDE_3 domain-containing protein [Trichonephila clavipes]